MWIGWFGFNGGSLLTAQGDNATAKLGDIFFNTNISAAACAIAAMFITWVRYGKPDVTMTLNGALAGLVASTAGCDTVSAGGAFFIGITAGFVMVFGVELITKLKADDPVGAVSVHGLCGAWGTLMTGVFAKKSGLIRKPEGSAYTACRRAFSGGMDSAYYGDSVHRDKENNGSES